LLLECLEEDSGLGAKEDGNMKKLLPLAALCFAAASAAQAGEVFGTISENGKPLAAGATLKLECGEASGQGATDQFGSYSIRTASSGDCRLILTYKGASPSVKVTLFEKPTRYDLVVKEEGGKVTLSRK
jgi:hypothetical protein